MLLLRIKQAEWALREGRLEEACRQAAQEDIRQHRRGQQLVGDLVAKLITRCRSHLDGGNLDAAAADCHRAVQLAGNQLEVLQLRREVADAAKQRAKDQRQRDQVAAVARSHIRQGELSAGAQLVDQLPADDSAQLQLRHEIEQHRGRIERALEHARQAIDNDDLDRAIVELVKVQRWQPINEQLRQLTRRVAGALLPTVRTAFAEGRLDQVERQLARLRPLAGVGTDELVELESALAELRSAADEIDRGGYQAARQQLKHAARMLPQLDWLAGVVQQLQLADETVEAIRTGPLGLLSSHHSEPQTPKQRVDSGDRQRHADVADAAPCSLPQRFLVQVDGIGSFLVVRKSTTVLGPVGSSRHPDIELVGMAAHTTVRFERTDEDYFLRSDDDVRINGQPRQEKLLTDGDALTLGNRCRITFNRPSAASTSGVLSFSATSLPRRDIRKVILLGDSVIIGPGRGSHIRTSESNESIIVYLQGDQLYCRADGISQPVELGKPVTAENISFVVTNV